MTNPNPRITKKLAGFALFLAAFAAASSLPARAQQQTPGRTHYDVQSYRIEAELFPAQHTMQATGDVTFTPLETTRSVVFEINGSLKVESIERNGKPLPNFVQDAVGIDSIGPSVRVDLGDVVPANQPVTLRFRWSGALVSAEGGALATKRLAYIGQEGSYLMYAARWFPFHDYAADRATADITITVPSNFEVAGVSDQPVTKQIMGGKARFHLVNSQPALIGSIVAAPYATRTLRYGNYELQFFVQPGYENRIEKMGETIGQTLDFYTKQYGAPAFGSRLSIAQIDDLSLDAYAAPGLEMVSTHLLDPNNQTLTERLEREVAYQWWGFTVGLKSFDDVWLSQGLAEWSAFALRERILTGGALEEAQRDMLERALMFEQTASILRAPSTLDDQSAAYQSIIYYKGAMVFRMLRETLGQQKFDQLLRQYLQQYRNKNASLRDFEDLTSQVAGENMRYFFARWVDSTGVPEFTADYQIIRTRTGKFRTRGTVKQNFENLKMPVELALRSEGGNISTTTVMMNDKSEDFDFESNGQPVELIVDPNNRLMKNSDDLRIAVVARKGIELYREGQYSEAQRALEEALKLNRSSSWIEYNLGLLFLDQRNYEQAKDHLQAAIDGDLKPSWIEAWAHIKRGNAYDAEGDRARAVNEYQKAVETGVNYDNAQRVAKQFLATPYDPRTTQAAENSQ